MTLEKEYTKGRREIMTLINPDSVVGKSYKATLENWYLWPTNSPNEYTFDGEMDSCLV